MSVPVYECVHMCWMLWQKGPVMVLMALLDRGRWCYPSLDMEGRKIIRGGGSCVESGMVVGARGQVEGSHAMMAPSCIISTPVSCLHVARTLLPPGVVPCVSAW